MNIQVLQDRIDEHKAFSWTTALIIGLAFRFLVLRVTGNVDFDNFYRTASLASEGKNIYANMTAYNYGALFSIILGKVYTAAAYLGGSVLTYKILHVGVLSVTDFLIAKLVEKKAGTLWGILFFLNPISMIVDSYHTQFDNIAVMFGAYGVFCLESSAEDDRFSLRDILGVILLSLSLITKHIMYAFPVYVLFSTRIKTRKKLLYALVPPLLFLASFLPYWAEGAEGIIRNVFMYRSFGNFPLFAVGLMPHYAPVSYANSSTNLFLSAFVVLMTASAYLFRHERIFPLFLVYTIAVVSFTSGASGQQLVIPCMAMLLLFREKSWPYFALIFSRLAGKQVMLTSEAWCLLYYLVHYYRHNTSR